MEGIWGFNCFLYILITNPFIFSPTITQTSAVPGRPNPWAFSWFFKVCILFLCRHLVFSCLLCQFLWVHVFSTYQNLVNISLFCFILFYSFCSVGFKLKKKNPFNVILIRSQEVTEINEWLKYVLFCWNFFFVKCNKCIEKCAKITVYWFSK